MSRFERQAQRLSIRHELISLETGGPKQWRFGRAGEFGSVEVAALDHYAAEGWSGAASEGGLILTLIKAASFARFALRNADTFIEAVFPQNVAFEEENVGAVVAGCAATHLTAWGSVRHLSDATHNITAPRKLNEQATAYSLYRLRTAGP